MIEPYLVPIRTVQAWVAAQFGVSLDHIKSDRRMARLVRPRHAAMYLAQRCTAKSLPQIGLVFLRHHTSVMHAIRSTEDRMTREPGYAAWIEAAEIELSVNWLPTVPEIEPEPETTKAIIKRFSHLLRIGLRDRPKVLLAAIEAVASGAPIYIGDREKWTKTLLISGSPSSPPQDCPCRKR